MNCNLNVGKYFSETKNVIPGVAQFMQCVYRLSDLIDISQL